MIRELMSWEECKNHLRTVDKDIQKANSILRMCKVRLRVLQQIALDEETASILAEDYYEIIKELLTALLLLKGLKSDNHECLLSYFKKSYPDKEYELSILYELKKARNSVSYEGLFLRKEYIERNKLEFLHIIKFLNSQSEEVINISPS